jgi:hypothetical protein
VLIWVITFCVPFALDGVYFCMTAQEIAIKLKKELPNLVQPGQLDLALVEVYEDALYLSSLVNPYDTDYQTLSILKKYLPEEYTEPRL